MLLKNNTGPQALITSIAASLLEQDNEKNRKRWIAFIIEKEVPLSELLPLLKSDPKTAMRFSWMLGGLAEEKPALLQPILATMFLQQHEYGIPNFERSLAKFFYLCGIPDNIESEAINALFSWLSSPVSIISTKDYALKALLKTAAKYPDLKNELRLVLADLQENLEGPLAKKVRKALEGMTGAMGKGK